ncbi:4'-phosphopantetheinyl transferase superfamily protein [bacterium]|nr:4'-phosphopantetheinyl transferase superfamily protein [bacterium]
MNNRDLAIVGMGCAFPQARNVREYWQNVINGVDSVETPPAPRFQHARDFTFIEEAMAVHRGGFLPKDLSIDPQHFGILPNAIKHGEADQFLMLLVTDAALKDAGFAANDPRRKRTDVLIGRGAYPGAKHCELWLRGEIYDTALELIDRKFPEMMPGSKRSEVEAWLRQTLPPNEVDSLATAIPNIVASRVANRLDLGGLAETVDGACASSLLALEHAGDRLRSGRSDVAIVGGVFLAQVRPFLLVFNRLHAVSKSGVIRPMDRRADGLVIGEGAGAIVLKRLEDAVADGDRIYAIVKGTGSASDGRHLDVLAPAWQGQVEACHRAYADAKIDPAQIGYLELHGTGTVAGDTAEITTIREIFGTSKHPPTSRAMGSVKSQIGHLMPAAGMAALIRTALSLSNKLLPPSLHCEEPREELLESPFYLNPYTRPWVQNESRGPRHAAINAFGFGGINVHAILEEVQPTKIAEKTQVSVPRPLVPDLKRPSELALFSAASTKELVSQIQQLLTFIENDQQNVTATDLSKSLVATLQFNQPVKLGVVYESIAELVKKLSVVLTELAKPTPKFIDDTIYYATDVAQHHGKIGFIFPGMGFPGLIGNYPDHLMELCLHYPELRAEFDFFEERDRNPDDDVPTSSVFVPPASLPEEYRTKLKNRLGPPKDTDFLEDQKPEERYLSAMGVTLANWISWTLLKQFEIPVDAAAGQSQGEMAAICAAGMGDFRETAPAYWRVLNITPKYENTGRLAFTWATEEQVAPLVAQNPNTYIAMYVGPSAIILGGDREGLVRITDALKKERVLASILPYPAIHTPMLSHLRKELDEALEDEPFAIKPATMTLYSSITTEPYPLDEDGVRHTLALNLDHPLRVWQTILRMYQDGIRIFVQVGGGHMAARVQDFTSDAEPAVSVALDVDNRNPITQLNHLLATLFVTGVPFNPQPLFNNRIATVLDLTQPRGEAAKPKMLLPLRIEWTPLTHPSVPPKPITETAPEAKTTAEATPVTKSVEPPSKPELAAPMESTPTAVAPTKTIEDCNDCSHGFFEGVDFEQNSAVVEFEGSSLPVLINGRVTRYVEGQELLIERVLDAEQDRYIYDHLFITCPPKAPRHCLPIVPMTMSLEFIAETAALLCPGLGVIGYENVKAMRWIGLEDRLQVLLFLDAKVFSVDEETGETRVDVTISFQDKRAFAGRVVLGTAYTQNLQMEWPDLSDAPAWPVEITEAYEGRRMFHGPSFHVMTHLDAFSNPVATGKLRVLPKNELFQGLPEPNLLVDPCLLDGIGQFVGLWCQMHDWHILPIGVEKVELYGPTPPVGTDCPIKMMVTTFDVDTKQLKANFEIEDGSGNVWMRFYGWGDWIFRWTPEFLDFNRYPTQFPLSKEIALPGLPEGALAVFMEERHFVGVDPLWIARASLTNAEIAELRQYESAKQMRKYLLSRMALKDAIRLWRSRVMSAGLTHPAEYHIDHDELGKPYVVGITDEFVPCITVTRKDNVAVAIASWQPLGVDAEPADRDTRSILDSFATPQEIELVDQLAASQPEAGWETRFWCAKEAAGKARGTGLNGYPKRLQVKEADESGRMVVQDTETSHHFEIQTTQWDAVLIATAVPLAELNSAAEGTVGAGHDGHAG